MIPPYQNDKLVSFCNLFQIEMKKELSVLFHFILQPYSLTKSIKLIDNNGCDQGHVENMKL